MSDTLTTPKAGTQTGKKTKINVHTLIPDIIGSLGKTHQSIGTAGLDPKLHHLVLLRASQMNKCPFCIDMHIREAKLDGETDDRLNRVIVWHLVDDFTPREKAALAWTEALTELPVTRDLEPLRAELARHFDKTEIALLTAAVAMINLWNRFHVATY